jgi:tetratricopeptide (TPR) repeat protein
MIVKSYKEAKDKFLTGDFSGEEFFKQNDFLLEYAYCRLLSGNVDSANASFLKIAKQDFRADWARKLIQFIQGYVTNVPSYFQIRNFLEIDLNLLIKAGQAQYVENIINGADLFYSINPESYKFIARVMFYNDYPEIALYYLLKAKDKFYGDPEMHFMLANCYAKQGDVLRAKESIKNCLNILPAYFPAKKLLDTLP